MSRVPPESRSKNAILAASQSLKTYVEQKFCDWTQHLIAFENGQNLQMLAVLDRHFKLLSNICWSVWALAKSGSKIYWFKNFIKILAHCNFNLAPKDGFYFSKFLILPVYPLRKSIFGMRHFAVLSSENIWYRAKKAICYHYSCSKSVWEACFQMCV